MAEGGRFVVMVAGIAQAGMEDYVHEYLQKMMRFSQADKGCELYNIHQSCENPREFMMYSLWHDKAAFEEHNKQPKMQEFKQKLAESMFDIRSPKTYWQLLGEE